MACVSKCEPFVSGATIDAVSDLPIMYGSDGSADVMGYAANDFMTEASAK